MMKSIFYSGIIIVASMALFSGCYYDNELELYGAPSCDTTAVSYSLFVENIMSDNCYVCHSAAANFGGVTLEGYDATKVYVNNGRLLGAIKHAPDFSAMPQGAPKLPDCTINKIEAWIDAGALNN